MSDDEGLYITKITNIMGKIINISEKLELQFRKMGDKLLKLKEITYIDKGKYMRLFSAYMDTICRIRYFSIDQRNVFNRLEIAITMNDKKLLADCFDKINLSPYKEIIQVLIIINNQLIDYMKCIKHIESEIGFKIKFLIGNFIGMNIKTLGDDQYDNMSNDLKLLSDEINSLILELNELVNFIKNNIFYFSDIFLNSPVIKNSISNINITFDKLDELLRIKI